MFKICKSINDLFQNEFIILLYIIVGINVIRTKDSVKDTFLFLSLEKIIILYFLFEYKLVHITIFQNN